MNKTYKKHSKELIKVLNDVDDFHKQIDQVVEQLQGAFKEEKKVLVAGNGGSAAEAQHLSDEMVGRYKEDRAAYPVIALTADTAVITCIGNDYGYDQVFVRQVDALGRQGDIFIGLTTSGTSNNILIAAKRARELGMTVIAFTGQKGAFKDMADYAIVSPSETGARIQEMHLHAIHLICEAFEPKKSS
jgi:D-sedoheptulose 7-phosphate isomerase